MPSFGKSSHIMNTYILNFLMYLMLCTKLSENHVTSSFTISDQLSVATGLAISAALYWILEYRLSLVLVHP